MSSIFLDYPFATARAWWCYFALEWHLLDVGWRRSGVDGPLTPVSELLEPPYSPSPYGDGSMEDDGVGVSEGKAPPTRMWRRTWSSQVREDCF